MSALGFAVSKLRLLDLFCGAGGAGMGYHRAGFEVVGVDLSPQPRYPFTFHQADALDFLRDHGAEFDAIHASPPCQRWSLAMRMQPTNKRLAHPDLITPLRPLLAGRAFVIENVPLSPLRPDIVLTGPMFGLYRIQRRRIFETSMFCLQPPLQRVPRSAWVRGYAMTITSSLSSSTHFYARKRAGLPGRVSTREACEAMGIDWPMTSREVGNAIPPDYTEWIGRQLAKSLTDSAAVRA